MVQCRLCHQRVTATTTRCPSCGAELPRGGLGGLVKRFRQLLRSGTARSTSQGPPQAQPTVPDTSPKNQPSIGAGFRLKVDDVFAITGRGTVVVGTIQCGRIRLHDTVSLTSRGQLRTCRVLGIEMARKLVDEATQGGRVGLLLSDINKNDVDPGTIVRTP